jgi:hypothetical protein
VVGCPRKLVCNTVISKDLHLCHNYVDRSIDWRTLSTPSLDETVARHAMVAAALQQYNAYPWWAWPPYGPAWYWWGPHYGVWGPWYGSW